MDKLIVLQMQGKVEATLIIVSLLLVSAIIGYVTAWLYSRYIHRKDIKTLSSESEKLKKQIATQKEEISDLQKKLDEKNNELETLKNDDASHVSENNPHGKKDDLPMISGIGPFIEERLNAMGVNSFDQISKFNHKDIEEMNVAIEYFAGRIERDNWIAQARELVNEEEREEALDRIRARKTQIYFDRIGIANKNKADDLTAITGIGGWIEKKLNVLEIYTFKQIANFNNEDIELVTEAIEYFPGRIERDEWVHQAQELVRINGKKADLLNKIAEKKDVISKNSLGEVFKHQANNLTLINGISPWIEERLNLLTIYTFEQISKLSPKEVKSLSEILEVSPKRIQKENWIGQAKELSKKKISLPLQ